MEFVEICEVFEKLEKTSKRLEKVLILRDFAKNNQDEFPFIFDLISGSYQREIKKKNIGISIKTLISVISFVSEEKESIIEKEFNKKGDIGIIAQEFIKDKKQSILNESLLNIEQITNSFSKISKTTGQNSNKVKKEMLSKLFLGSKSNLENKFLARILLDDLRIGVSEGVLKEAYLNSIIPRIIGINILCSNCNYVNLNIEKCLECSKKLNQKEEDSEIKTVIETDDIDKLIESNISSTIKSKEPRLLYNKLVELLEKKYNLLNSFRKLNSDIVKDKKNLFNAKIEIFNPIKSMLGVRAKNLDEALEVTKMPSLFDFKYDGLRVQIHNNYGKVLLFSRNLDEITKQFPEVVKFIKENFDDVSFVIDSECVGYDFEKKKFLPFQILSRRILTKKIDEVSHIKVVVKAFDIMYLNKETLIDLTYKERREILEKIFLNRPLKQELNFNLKNLNQQ